MRESFQFISLCISIVVILSFITLSFLKRNGLFFYICMILAWFPGVIYYSGILYFRTYLFSIIPVSPEDLSAMIRTYQYLLFGMWFITDAVELLNKKIRAHLRIIKSRVRK